MSSIRVLIADDEPVVPEILADVVRMGDDLELVGMAPDAAEALALSKQTRPDVAVLDVKMPGGGGLRATREIRAACPDNRVVALSAFDDREAVLEMLRVGAGGYVVKGARAEEILEGIRRAARGEAPLSSDVAAEVIDELAGRLEREAPEEERQREATRRILRVLEGDELGVMFQPIFDLEAGRFRGAEALARFTAEPPRGPDAWFEEAASVGLGIELELKAVEVALEKARSLPDDVYLSLNVSPAAVTSEGFPDVLSETPFERTVVEITEHAPVSDYDVLAEALQAFRSEGGRVAIDDAGAGFASLRHIVRLAPDLIKLNISLTRGIHVDRTRRAMAAALISFARETESVIVAEGVETQEELDVLRELGVAQAQGYYLARPGPPDQIRPNRTFSGWVRPWIDETA